MRLSALLKIIFLLSAKDLIVFHSSCHRLEYLIYALGSSNNSFSTWYKITSRQGWPSGGCRLDFRLNTGTSVKFSDSNRKCYFKRILLQNSLKSLFSSGWFNFLLFLCTVGLTEASFEVLRNSSKIFKTYYHLHLTLQIC